MGRILGVALLLAICAGMFASVRARVGRRPELRTRIAVLASAFVALGLAVALWLPTRFAETPGSPASMAGTAVSWIAGACLVLIGLPSLLGALLASPDRERDD